MTRSVPASASDPDPVATDDDAPADPFPVLTRQRALAILDAECAWFRRYLDVLGRYEENRLGVSSWQPVADDRCFATRCTSAPSDFFRNRLLRSDLIPAAELPDTLARVHDWFAPHGCRGCVDTVPGVATLQLLAALPPAGFAPNGHMRQFWGIARDARDELAELAERGVVVRELDADNPDDRAAFVRIYEAAEDDIQPVGDVTLTDFAHAEFGMAADDEWTGFVAEVDGVPQGIAALHRTPGGTVGSCSGAWTHPDGRRRGAQLALLLARMTRAHDDGCELVLSQTGPGLDNPSARNIQRAGLRIAWMSSFWTIPAPAPTSE